MIEVGVGDLEQRMVLARASGDVAGRLALLVAHVEVSRRVGEEQEQGLAARRLLGGQVERRLAAARARIHVGRGMDEHALEHAVAVPVGGRVQRRPAHLGARLELTERRHVAVVAAGLRLLER